jgi:hypothetical protein
MQKITWWQHDHPIERGRGEMTKISRRDQAGTRFLGEPQEGLIIKIGQVRWLVYDRVAYRSMTAAWTPSPKDVGAIVLARR